MTNTLNILKNGGFMSPHARSRHVKSGWKSPLWFLMRPVEPGRELVLRKFGGTGFMTSISKYIDFNLLQVEQAYQSWA